MRLLMTCAATSANLARSRRGRSNLGASPSRFSGLYCQSMPAVTASAADLGRPTSAPCASSRTRSAAWSAAKPEANPRGGDRAAPRAPADRGHPGVARRRWHAHSPAALGGTFRRISSRVTCCRPTSSRLDLRQSGKVFELNAGRIFANVVLADENQPHHAAHPVRHCSSDERGPVSIDDTTHDSRCRFMVIATQNPAEHYAQYPLRSRR